MSEIDNDALPAHFAKKRKESKRATKPKRTDWDRLFTLINEYTEAAIGESWKGGGDPAEFEIHELRLKLARSTLNYHIGMMKAKYE